MKNALEAILLVCISTWLCSCTKFSIGDTKTASKDVNMPFQVIEFCDDVNVQLLHCDARHPAGTITVEAGENLLDNITAEIEDVTEDTLTLNKLIISNKNTLNYLHTYDYSIDMVIYYDTLYRLVFTSNARSIETDTLRGYECLTQFTQDTTTWFAPASNLHILVEGGSGEFKVLTNCERVTTKYNHGTADIQVSGITVISSTYAGYDCHGIIDMSELETRSHYITSYGTNTIIGRAFHTLSLHNANVGRIYYIKYQKKMPKVIWGHLDETGHWIDNDTIDTIYNCPQILIPVGDNIMPYP